jgi:hypothetical protein
MRKNKSIDAYCREARSTSHVAVERTIVNPSTIISRNPFVTLKIAQAQAHKYGEQATGIFRSEGQVIPS